MFVVKILGIIDIITALAIFLDINLLILTVPLFLIHLIKGLMSMVADLLGRIYGIVDIVSAFAILFILNLPFVLEAFLVIILMFKGITSLL